DGRRQAEEGEAGRAFARRGGHGRAVHAWEEEDAGDHRDGDEEDHVVQEASGLDPRRPFAEAPEEGERQVEEAGGTDDARDGPKRVGGSDDGPGDPDADPIPARLQPGEDERAERETGDAAVDVRRPGPGNLEVERGRAAREQEFGAPVRPDARGEKERGQGRRSEEDGRGNRFGPGGGL